MIVKIPVLIQEIFHRRITEKLSITTAIPIVDTVLVAPAVCMRASSTSARAAARGRARLLSVDLRDGHVSKGDGIVGVIL